MHTLLDCDPLRSVTRKIALVHRERHWCQINLANETGHSGNLNGVRVAKELAARDEPAQLVAAQPRNVVDPAAFRLGDPIPTFQGCARSVHGDPVILPKADRRRLNSDAVDGQLQLSSE